MDKRKSLEELEELNPKELELLLVRQLMKLESNDIDLQYIKDIINMGADMEFQDKNTGAAIGLSISYGHSEVAKLLIASGVNLESMDNRSNCIPLHLAAYHENIEIVKSLIEAGANLESRDHEGWTALHYTARYYCTNSCLVLIAAGASKEVLNNEGRTPWDMADRNTRLAIPELNPNYND